MSGLCLAGAAHAGSTHRDSHNRRVSLHEFGHRLHDSGAQFWLRSGSSAVVQCAQQAHDKWLELREQRLA
jgi:hypothetical protein